MSGGEVWVPREIASMSGGEVLCYTEEPPQYWGGLSDRVWVLTGLLTWAWASNVTLNVPPPCKMLTPMHNLNIPIDCHVTWDHYFTMKPSHLFTTNPCWVPCSLQLTKFYELNDLVSIPVETESPVSVTHSSYVIEETSKLSKDMKLPREYDMLHIRRTDVIKYCDTSISRMERILSKHTFATTHVLYASDERDANYNNRIIQTLQNRNLTVDRPYDWLVGRFPRDNYMVFSIEQRLYGNAAATHQWRRQNCPSA